MNRRHKTVLALSFAVAGLALWNDARISQALGIILVGGSVAWLVGSQFVLAGAVFVWRHRVPSAIIVAAGVGALYGWIRYEDGQTERVASEAPPQTLTADTPTQLASETPPQTLTLDTPTQPPAAHRTQPAAKRGKAVLKRNTCDGLVVYDREEYGGGDPLVIDQLAMGAAVQVLGHVTVSDEDIIKTPTGQRGFVRPGCLEAIPAAGNGPGGHKG